MQRLEQAKSLEAKIKATKKASAKKPGPRAAGLAALRTSLSAHGLGGALSEAGVAGLPSLAELVDAPKAHRKNDVWLRSKDLSTKRPSSDKLYPAFEAKMAALKMPVRPIPTEANVTLYNQCRAHVVLLVELEAQFEKVVAVKHPALERKVCGAGHATHPPPTGSSHKRSSGEHRGGSHSHKRSHH